MEKLFVYGTLLDPEILLNLFGRNVSAIPYKVEGYTTEKASDGYLSLVKSKGQTTDGSIIELTEDELFDCDIWEEMPLYERVKLECSDIDAWVYLRDENEALYSAPGVQPYTDGLYKVARELRAELDEAVSIYDFYVFLPCRKTNQFKPCKRNNNEHKFVKTFYDSMVPDYMYHEKIKFDVCDNTLLTWRAEDGSSNTELRSTVYLLSDTRLDDICILMFAVPVCYLNPDSIADYIFSEQGYYISMKGFSSEIGLEIIAKPKFVFFFKTRIEEKLLHSILNAEELCVGRDVTGTFASEVCTNIAQYSTAEIYASHIAVVEFPSKFDLSYDARSRKQIATLFLIGILELHEAGMAMFRHDLHESTEKPDLDNLISRNFSINSYWDSGYFHYSTSRKLADAVAEKVGEQRLRKSIVECNNMLEKVLLNEQKKSKEISDNRLNIFMLLFTLIALYDTLIGFFDRIMYETSDINITANIVYAVVCVVAVLIFKKLR